MKVTIAQPVGEVEMAQESTTQESTSLSTKKKRSRKLRLLSMVAGSIVIVLVAIVGLNLGAGQADGAAAEDVEEATAADGTEATETEEGEEAEEGDEKAPVPVQVTEVSTGDVSAFISATANLVAENEVMVLSEVEGRVATLLVEEGDFVRKGQHLVSLVRNEEEIQLRKATLQEENARAAYQRAADLMDKELISQEEHDRLKVDFEIAQEVRAEAQWSLERTTIRSPFSGRVTGRMTQAGHHVRPGDELFKITDFDPLVARIYLPERDVIGLDTGREVRISLNADQSVSLAGRIQRISPIVDTATGTVKITVAAISPPKEIRPGSFVTIDIVRETHEDTLLLPREAVLRELQKAHVFIADGELAEKRAVTLGLEEGDYVEALTGVEAGDQVIVAGQGGLRDGSPVKVLEAEAAG